MVMEWTFLATVLIAGPCMVSYWVGRYRGRLVERRESEARQTAAQEHRARMLRERGRLTDVREDATGEPAVVRPMRVLGKSPRHKPPTRM